MTPAKTKADVMTPGETTPVHVKIPSVERIANVKTLAWRVRCVRMMESVSQRVIESHFLHVPAQLAGRGGTAI